MKNRLLCVLIVAALLLGVLAGCGSSSSGGSNPDNPGVGSTESDKPDMGGYTNDDPVAVMSERVKAVNDAVNWEYIGVEEKVEAGLLFYSLTANSSPDSSEPHDYNPDKPLDYYAWYRMIKLHTEGIVSEDTYAALLKDARPWNIPIAAFSEENVIETDDLYVYCEPGAQRGNYSRSRCFILIKDTDILYCFNVEELWYMADYYGNGHYYFPNSGTGQPEQNALNLSYTGDDVEYIFTPEFWKAFAQTAKFVGNADDDFKDDELINDTISTIGARGKGVKVPYIEEWYAGGSYDPETIRKGFEDFLENHEVEVVFDLDDGTVKSYPATTDGDLVTIDLGNGQVWIYAGGGDGGLKIWEEPKNVTGERLPDVGYIRYQDDQDRYGFLVIDDFGQGEPTMFFNNGLYKYAGGGEVVLIHDFSDIDDGWMSMSIDPGRKYLLSSGEPMYGENLRIVDLKTFEVTDEVNIYLKQGDDHITEFASGDVNGVSVDEETAWETSGHWIETCNIGLLGRGAVEEIDFDAAWRGYESRS